MRTASDTFAIDVAPRASLPLTALLPEHAAYLEKRGILAAARKIGVRSTMGRQRKESPRIALLYPNGWLKLYDPQSDDPWRQQKPTNARLPLWRIDQADFSRPWILTEGEWDCLAAIEAGEANALSLPDGAVSEGEANPAASGKLVAIREAWPQIQGSRAPITLAMDNDANGETTRRILIEIFGAWRCRCIEYPEHPNAQGVGGRCKDINEVLQLFGPRETLSIIRAAKPVPLDGVFRLSEIPKPPKREFIDPGIPGLDRYLKLFRGELCVVTAHTSHGKTSTLLNILGYLAQANYRIGLGTFEADPWNDILPWYQTWLFGDRPHDNARADTEAWLEERFAFISNVWKRSGTAASVEWFIQQCRDAKGRHGLDVALLDPWNKLAHERKPGEAETEYVGRALGDLYAFGNAAQVVNIISTHPNKATYVDGHPRLPTAGDVSGSMNFGNAPDHFLSIWRPDMTQTISCFSVQKRRVKGSGRIGRHWCSFDENTNRYSQLPSEVAEEWEQNLGRKKTRPSGR